MQTYVNKKTAMKSEQQFERKFFNNKIGVNCDAIYFKVF